MKFGGTSLADIDCISNVAERVLDQAKTFRKIVVVVSAMSGTTNQLIELAKSTKKFSDPSEYDVVVSSGEQISAGLLSIVLKSKGLKSRSWMGWQIPLKTDNKFSKSLIEFIDIKDLNKSLEAGEIAVVTGFRGCK
jgi:Aspartokinases